MSTIRKLAKEKQKLTKSNETLPNTTVQGASQNCSDENGQEELRRESGLGALDFNACVEATKSAAIQKRKSYKKWTDQERFEEEIENARKQNREINMRIEPLPRGRPFLLGATLDEMLRKILLALRSRGGLVSSTIAKSAAKALIARNPHLNLSHIDLDSSSFTKSLFKRMGYVRRMKTTGKVEIPEGAIKEAEFPYLHKITSLIEKFKIPKSLVLNLDQTPLKYIPAMNFTMAKRNSKSVSIAGSTDKRSITGTFVFTLDGSFLPLQLIYGSKIKQSLPRFKFSKEFSLSCNLKHYSNMVESQAN